jgi:hypothetical protein
MEYAPLKVERFARLGLPFLSGTKASKVLCGPRDIVAEQTKNDATRVFVIDRNIEKDFGRNLGLGCGICGRSGIDHS